MLFNVNSWEILVLVALFMVLFGPDRLPKVIGQVVKLLRDLQQMSDSATADLRRELEAATKAVDLTTVSTTGRKRPPRTGERGSDAPSQPATDTSTGAGDTEHDIGGEQPDSDPDADSGDAAAQGDRAAAEPGAAVVEEPPSRSIFRAPDDGAEDADTTADTASDTTNNATANTTDETTADTSADDSGQAAP